MIYLDMDGVIADWDGSAERLLGGKPITSISKNQLWKKIDAEGFKFWSELKQYPWSEDFVALLKRLDEVRIASSPSNDPRSASGKLRWLQKFFGDRNFRDYHFTPKKHDLAKAGAILIDDREKHIDPFIENGGVGILFPQEWNRNRAFAGNPVEFVTERLKEIYPASRFPEEEDSEDYDDWLKSSRSAFEKNNKAGTR